MANTNLEKMLLIAPYASGLEEPTSYPPLGLLYVASNLPAVCDIDVHIMESEEFDKFGYDSYGISIHSVGVYKSAMQLATKIHKVNPRAEIMVGGSGAALVKQTSWLTKIEGEAEPYFEKDVADIDLINFPARHLIDDRFIVNTSVHHTGSRATTMIATRGCPYRCSFCDRTTLGTTFRKRSIENISKEAQYLIARYGIEFIRFVDDCITIDKKWFAELCMELKTLGLKWTVLSRADRIDPKLLKLMKKCGCQEIFFGFESGSDRMLKLMQKKITVAQNIKAVEMCKDAGIVCCAYMMFGFPGEDEKSVADTIAFLEYANPNKSRITQFVPIPQSDVWINRENYGIRVKRNYQDYWCFDRHDFGLHYDYIDEDVMYGLRDTIFDYYEKKYKQSWKKVLTQ